MIQLTVLILYLILLLRHAEADKTDSSENHSPEFPVLQPSILVVLAILSMMSVITLLLFVYIKLCRGGESADSNPPQNDTGLISSSNRFSGIDKSIIESLPFFRFSSLKGSKNGLECAVCLSKFEDDEVLRLLPKCKHAFHINCIDHWLEKHSSCPLCRQKVSSEDLALTGYSNSARLLSNNLTEMREDSKNIELFVQREESQRGSSRFGIESSSRKIHEKDRQKEAELLIQKQTEADHQKVFHKHNHKITVSDFLSNNRWSNLSSSDLIFLNSEMLNYMSSSRFFSKDWNIDMSSAGKAAESEETMKAKEEMEFRNSFQSKVGTTSTSVSGSVMNSGEQRSVSEIASLSRYGRFTETCSVYENNVKDERTRKVWLPIARRTIHWLANREKSTQRQSLDV